MVEDRVVEIAERLNQIVEELTDVAYEILREAVEDGATSRPPLEKKVMIARRAVEKAAHTLESAS